MKLIVALFASALMSVPQASAQDRVLMFFQGLAWSPHDDQLAFAALYLAPLEWHTKKVKALVASDFDVYVMRLTDEHTRRLVVNPKYDVWLSWSPDGSKIVFGSNRQDNVDLYVVDERGSHEKRLTTGPGRETQPAWSPDGRRIAFVEQSAARQPGIIWVMNADGTSPEALTQPGLDRANPEWSPDGKQLAYFGRSSSRVPYEVFTMTVDNKTESKPLATGVLPTWVPDGSGITYVSKRGVELLDLHSGKTRLLVDKGLYGRFSHDGRRIAAVLGNPPETTIHIMNFDGSNDHPLTRELASDSPRQK